MDAHWVLQASLGTVLLWAGESLCCSHWIQTPQSCAVCRQAVQLWQSWEEMGTCLVHVWLGPEDTSGAQRSLKPPQCGSVQAQLQSTIYSLLELYFFFFPNCFVPLAVRTRCWGEQSLGPSSPGCGIVTAKMCLGPLSPGCGTVPGFPGHFVELCEGHSPAEMCSWCCPWLYGSWLCNCALPPVPFIWLLWSC